MAMKLRTLPTGAPRRTPFGAAGSDLGSTFFKAARLEGESVSPVMSFTWPDRSRMVPSVSQRPGFSAPGAPKRTSFMGFHSGVRWCGALWVGQGPGRRPVDSRFSAAAASVVAAGVDPHGDGLACPDEPHPLVEVDG